MKKARKVLAFCLALVMCAGLLTFGASAEEEKAVSIKDAGGEIVGEYDSVQEAMEAVEEGQTIVLNQDVTEDVIYIKTNNITLDFNGHYYQRKGTYPYDFYGATGTNPQMTLIDSAPGGVEYNICGIETVYVDINILSGSYGFKPSENRTMWFECGTLNILGGRFEGALNFFTMSTYVYFKGGEFINIVGHFEGPSMFSEKIITGGTFNVYPNGWQGYPVVVAENYSTVKNFIPIDGCENTWTVVKGIKDDPNGGQWADGNGDVKDYDLVDGEEFSHDELTRNGYTLTGWEMSEDDGIYTFTAQWEQSSPDSLTLAADIAKIYTNDDPSTAVLTLTYEPEDAELGEIEWTQEGAGAVEFVTASENSAGSGSDADGAGAAITKTVKALTPGEVTITATDTRSGKSASVTMNVVAVMAQTEPTEPAEPETGEGEVDIGEGDTPLDDAPDTGDATHTALWIAAAVISGAVLALIMIPKKKEN